MLKIKLQYKFIYLWNVIICGDLLMKNSMYKSGIL
jgi:hypothetical protein